MNNINTNNMYELPHIYGNNDYEIVLPKNMYQMKQIYDKNVIKDNINRINEQMSGKNDSINDSVKSETKLLNIEMFGNNDLALNGLKDLLSRQQLLLTRIQYLQSIDEDITQTIGHQINDNFVEQKDNVLNTCSETETVNKEMKRVEDIVIFSNVNQMPISVFAIINSMKSLGLKVMLNLHNHSSLNTNTNDSHFDHLIAILDSIGFHFESNKVNSRLENDLIVSIIFKDISESQMIMSPLDLCPIIGEANILRFMASIAAKLKPELNYLYEGIDDLLILNSVNNFVDEIHRKLFIETNDTNYISNLDSVLNDNNYLTGKSPSIADLLLWSSLYHKRSESKLSPNLEEWFTRIKNFISTQII